jgi:hypothetical protein
MVPCVGRHSKRICCFAKGCWHIRALCAAKPPPFTASTGQRSPFVAGGFGYGYLSVRVSGEGVAQGNGNAIANAVQGLLQVSGAGCLKGRG